MDSIQAQAAAEANRLYWETELSVGDIAQRLDISRRALYDTIRAVPAPGRCNSCGGELEFTNRSARTHGFATCRSCGVQTQAEGEPAPWTWSPPASLPGEPPTAAPVQSVWWLGTAALAGALLAAAATLALLRDD